MKKLNSRLTPVKVFVFCCLLLALAIAACKKNDTEQLAEQNELAKWYIQNKPTTHVSYFDDLKPQWESIYISEPSSELLVYEVKLSNPKKVYQKLSDESQKDRSQLRNNIRLLIFKDKVTKQIISSCYMSILNEGELSKSLDEIHYKRVNDLSGKIMFFNMLGKLENGWGYLDGQITMRFNGSLEGYYFGLKKPVLGDLKNPAITETGSRFDKLMTYTPEPCAFPQPDWRTSCVGVDGYMTCTMYLAGYFCVDQTPNGGGEGGYNPYGGNPGHGGGGSGSTGDNSTPSIEIKKDSIAAKFPCVKVMVLDSLETIPAYNKMVQPFIKNGQKPSLTWNATTQPWSDGNFSAGQTKVSSDSFTGMSSDININTAMLQQGSRLLIAATIIHETYHAYINYLFASSGNVSLVNSSKPNYMAGLYQYIIYEKTGNSNNYTDHYNMLTSQFDNFTDILYSYGKGNFTIDDCRKTLLFGMNNPGPNPEAGQQEFINQAYNDLLKKYGYTADNINMFTLEQTNAIASKRIPNSGCQ
ncbi:hypothetical protein GCM10008119_13810 [Pedobacter mendelii]|uniref:Uncharacterized protein n=2 Tax=Pedobacter mendelii TaxID=1908240 RepID=A0ABQ2BI09_9SPHI|nr:hypothetical protein GCM10008119_13810 [Pedobacter mendelii]